ncbi:MAG: M24 family metallopeptidase [Candidatus Pacebacteria bacterium]|nr:M24 family metallopeptidase [Candidatus Paceibacterota bacterium]MDD3970067.1 M24 family metallopeptidase [Candidatus Paceibacterota bacterium]
MNIKSNIKANKKLDLIRIKIIKLIKENINKITEKDVSDFIALEMEKEGMDLDNIDPIHFVVINKNTDDSHWDKKTWKPEVIKNDSLIMIDYWAKIKGPNNIFADITWMFYTGNNIPKEIENIFNKVIESRNIALTFIKDHLKNKKIPKAREVDKAVREYFAKYGLEKYFTHKTGHSLGLSSCHGNKFFISKNSNKFITPNTPFTIEPGLYFSKKFGIRSEINCYIDENYKLVITSSVQDKIIKI